jgi:flagellar biosynthesis protein FlhB
VAEEQDRSQQTEEPTQRRLEEARRKGQVASSREVNHLLLLAAGSLFVALLAADMAVHLAGSLRPFLAAPHAMASDPGQLGRTLARLLQDVGAAALLPGLLFLIAALATGLVQNGPLWSATPLAPKLERISPLAGAKRLFSTRSLLEFAKGLLKITLVAAAGVALLWPSLPLLIGAAELEAVALLGLLRDLALRLLAGVTVLVAAIAALDVLYQRFEHRKRLRMSQRDLRDEFKQTEGDPYIKARLKSLRLERARRRMMAEVPKASVVVTNPTHIAVALRYDPETMAAPRLVAKGVDQLALRIREIARAHGVPVIADPPLARTLHAAVELGDEVPPAHYRAVAEVIGYVMRLRPRR